MDRQKIVRGEKRYRDRIMNVTYQGVIDELLGFQ